ncbi:hypothetical protein [Arachnia propionica]|uniref:Uncharacterized protein n=1 Tax=Arachnia propionica TaxID=1750 RepID=A0A3P1WPW7_9ACTN|nr:hypothetical protein [Arachnia propionica]RRD47390.1 hypothetical protein EII35_15020 [Arachnia propionica]
MMTTAEQEMPFPEDTREQISDLSSDLSRLAGAMSGATQLGQWDGQGVPGWVGEAADAYMGSIRMLHGKLGPVVDGMRHAAAQADMWYTVLGDAIDRAIPELHDQWRAVERKLEELRYGIEVTSSGEVCSADKKHNAMLESYYREVEMPAIKANYDQLIASLNTAAHDAAAQVRVAREMFLPPEVGSSRDEIGQELFKDGSILEAQTKWEYGQERAEEIADRLEQGFGNDEELRLFLEEYGEDLKSPFVATPLGSRFSPEQVVDLVMEVNNALDDDLSLQLMESLGTGMVLAAGGANLDPSNQQDQELFLLVDEALPELGSGENTLHNRYAQKLIEAGRKSYAMPWSVQADNSISGVVVFAQLMGQAASVNPSLALGEGFFRAEEGGASFMDELLRADALLRQSDRRVGMVEGWRINHGMEPGVGDPVHAMLTLMDRPEALDESANEDLVRFDRGRQQGVKYFLASDVDLSDVDIVDHDYDGDKEIGRGDKVANVVQHIMGRRTIGHPANYSGFMDGGELFGNLVREAAMPESAEGREDMTPEELKAWQERDGQGARIASGFLRGYQEGLENYESERSDVAGQRDFGVENPHIRSSAGDILGPRMRGIANSLDGYGSRALVGDGDPDGRYLISFDTDMANRLLGPKGVFIDLAFDGVESLEDDMLTKGASGLPQWQPRSAVDKLIMWSHIGYDRDLQDALEGPFTHGADKGHRVPHVSGRWATAFQTLFTAPDGASAEALEAVNRRNAWWQRAVHITADAGAGGLGLVTGPVGGLATSQVNQHIVHPVIDVALPDDFQVSEGYVPKGEVVEEYMSGILLRRALIDLDLAAESPDFGQYVIDNPVFGDEVLDENGDFKSPEALNEDSLSALKTYVVTGLPGWEFGESFRVMDLAVLQASQKIKSQKIDWGRTEVGQS